MLTADSIVCLLIAFALLIASVSVMWYHFAEKRANAPASLAFFSKKSEQKIFLKNNFEDFKYFALVVVKFEGFRKPIEHSFVVHKDNVQKLVDFFVWHHSDPGIDFDSGRRNCLVLERICVRYFWGSRTRWSTIAEQGSGIHSHSYPVDCMEMDKNEWVEMFSRKKKENETNEKKADIIPIR